MSEDLKQLIRDVGAEIQPKLEPMPGHPARNAYAHIFGMVRYLCNGTYSEADPIKVRAVVEAIRLDPNGDDKAILIKAKAIRREQLERDANDLECATNKD